MTGDDTLRGVSGGERKRTSIAVQLLTGTCIMMMMIMMMMIMSSMNMSMMKIDESILVL